MIAPIFVGFVWISLDEFGRSAGRLASQLGRTRDETTSLTLRSIALKFTDVLLRVKLKAELLN